MLHGRRRCVGPLCVSRRAPQFLYLAVVGSVLHGQDQLRGIGGQQVPVLRLVPLLPVQNLKRRERGASLQLQQSVEK
jgi:hypothetical protein